ncbi:MAG: succinylglutamate desuccinylase/aspartoacylase family protein [Alphaproteobacteria bacterium]|nr:succinylglutamate desuccinylase/aspartoacylase family protein [Alphaproteobacteria bacterium]MBO6628662.1 succinylglutamate desuccinylase/aspartoacylase family protein [Alphaproteobacteria bacterium]MDF1625293.1 succinylglutamate desuccinylase/aspartoacylase family protein [Parvibaculaceae bacterium]
MGGMNGFEIAGHHLAPGERRTVNLPISVLSDHTPATLSVHVVHGRKPGPTMFVSAAVHGDEIIGVEIVRRILRTTQLDRLRGTLLAIPIVNSYGFMNHSRYLPDRRDLNRSFPGSQTGSLAARLAALFMQEIVKRADYGIDLHSAAIHRTNLPQIRVSPSKQETMELAECFGAPLVMTSKVRDGSLRAAAQDAGIDVLLYEAGEGLRFDEFAVRAGVKGVLRVMHKVGMLSEKGISRSKVKPLLSDSSYWVRAPAGGLLRTFKTVGEQVVAGEMLGMISDPFGEAEAEITARQPGVIVGRSNLPVVNEGDGLFHVAMVRKGVDASETIDGIAAQLDADPLFDEDEII